MNKWVSVIYIQFRSHFYRCDYISILDSVIEKATVQNWSNKSKVDDEIHIFYKSEDEDKRKVMDEEKGVDLSSPEAMFSK